MAGVFLRLIALVLTVIGAMGLFAPVESLFDFAPAYDLADLAIAAAAVAVSFNETHSIALAKLIGIVYLVVSVCGLVAPALIGANGLDPAYIVIHLMLAAAALTVGFSSPSVEVIEAS